MATEGTKATDSACAGADFAPSSSGSAASGAGAKMPLGVGSMVALRDDVGGRKWRRGDVLQVRNQASGPDRLLCRFTGWAPRFDLWLDADDARILRLEHFGADTAWRLSLNVGDEMVEEGQTLTVVRVVEDVLVGKTEREGHSSETHVNRYSSMIRPSGPNPYATATAADADNRRALTPKNAPSTATKASAPALSAPALSAVGGGSVKSVTTPTTAEPLVVIGIDLGTFGSGTAYAQTSKPNDIVCEQGTRGGLKTATAVLLKAVDLSFVAFGDDAVRQYMQFEPEEQTLYLFFDRFKMSLYDERHDLDTRDTAQTLNAKNNDKSDAVAEPMLKATCGRDAPALVVFAAALKFLKDREMTRVRARSAHLQQSDVRFVLTVPAIWTPQAKAFMRRAAVAAGISPPDDTPESRSHFMLALESESAALCCQRSERPNPNLSGTAASGELGVGAQCLTLDVGGGTADITVHRLLDNEQVDEVCASTGGRWGSTYIDLAFLELVRRACGAENLAELKQRHGADYLELLTDFEVLKAIVMPSKPPLSGAYRIRLPPTLIRAMKIDAAPYGKRIPLPFRPHTTQPPIAIVPPVVPLAVSILAAPMVLTDHFAASSKPTATIPTNPIPKRDDGPLNKTTDSTTLQTAGGEDWVHITTDLTQSLTLPLPPATAKTPKHNARDVKVGPGGGGGGGGGVGGGFDVKTATLAPTAAKMDKTVDKTADKKTVDNKTVAGGEVGGDVVPGVYYKDQSFYIEHDTMLGLFDGVVRPTLDKLKSVLVANSGITHVFLVGGFAESQKLQEDVRAVCKSFTYRKLTLVCPPHAALAVLTGAVMIGLRPKTVTARVVKRTYGVAVSTEYNSIKHGTRTKMYRSNCSRPVAFCDNIFSKFCTAGEKVNVDRVVSQTYTPGEDSQDSMILRVYETSNPDPGYCDEAGCRSLGSFRVPMPDLNGGIARKVRVSMQFGLTEILFSALDFTSGETLPTATFKYTD